MIDMNDLGGQYAYFNVFYNVNVFCVFSRNFYILLMKFYECFFCSHQA